LGFGCPGDVFKRSTKRLLSLLIFDCCFDAIDGKFGGVGSGGCCGSGKG
jgi:hypothetical protein